jgi:hypothetical protein
MALAFGDIALAIAKGATEGAVEVQKSRQERLDKRIKELQKNDLELAKSKHATASKEYISRKTNVAAIQAAGDDYGKSFAYYKNIRGMNDADAKKAARSEPVQITEEMINNYIGDEPLLLNDSTVDYSGVEARSVLRDFGFGSDATEPPSEDQQIADARSAAASQMKSAMSVPLKPQVIPQDKRGAVPEYLRETPSESERKEQDMVAYLKKKYPQASDLQIQDIIYTQQGMKVGPTGIYSTLDESAAKVMGGDSELQAEKYRNRQQAEANMKNMKSYAMDTAKKDLLMNMIDTSTVINPDNLSDKAASGLFGNAANMQAELVRKGMDESVATNLVVAVHEGAVTEGGLFSGGEFDKTKVPSANQIISMWKDDGYYQDTDRILNLIYPQMTKEEVAQPEPMATQQPTPSARMGRGRGAAVTNPQAQQEEDLIPADQVMTPMQEFQVANKATIDAYKAKYPNRSVEEIIQAMQKKGFK